MAHQHCQHIKEYNIAINCDNIQNNHENVEFHEIYHFIGIGLMLKISIDLRDIKSQYYFPWVFY